MKIFKLNENNETVETFEVSPDDFNIQIRDGGMLTISPWTKEGDNEGSITSYCIDSLLYDYLIKVKHKILGNRIKSILLDANDIVVECEYLIHAAVVKKVVV